MFKFILGVSLKERDRDRDRETEREREREGVYVYVYVCVRVWEKGTFLLKICYKDFIISSGIFYDQNRYYCVLVINKPCSMEMMWPKI